MTVHNRRTGGSVAAAITGGAEVPWRRLGGRRIMEEKDTPEGGITMRAVVVYESMYGNTHTIADAVADGLRRSTAEVSVVPVGKATAELMQSADVVVVGAPTHVHGMSRPSTRASAIEAAHKPDAQLTLDSAAEGLGMRDWLAVIGPSTALAAAFDTRMPGPPAFTGRASHGIDRQLRRHGFARVAAPESFIVDKHNQLLPGETDRARDWGIALAATSFGVHA